MPKYKFTREYGFRASPKVIYPYLSTPGGLQEWFAEKVMIDPTNRFIFNWDNRDFLAEMGAHRVNKSCRFDFVDGENAGNFIEFKIETSDLDGSTFLKITDYSDNEDEDDLETLWDGLIDDLKVIVGG